MKTRELLILACLLLSIQFCYSQEAEKEYTELLKEIIEKRDSLHSGFTVANTSEKDSIITTARNYLIHKVTDELFPYWYGTQWDFNGTTRTPKKGTIACGYFVTNTLTDIGFDIPRIRWAQSASEVFIKKLAPQHIKRFSNKPISMVKNYLLQSGNGLYLVGLDSHVGYVYVNNGIVRFIHADYYEPEKGVVSEKLDSHSPIHYSSYRVIGKLLSDEMVTKWITKKAIR